VPMQGRKRKEGRFYFEKKKEKKKDPIELKLGERKKEEGSFILEKEDLRAEMGGWGKEDRPFIAPEQPRGESPPWEERSSFIFNYPEEKNLQITRREKKEEKKGRGRGGGLLFFLSPIKKKKKEGEGPSHYIHHERKKGR